MELMDGVLVDLLKTKWNTFVKAKFYRQFYCFATYFLISLISFTLRPGPILADEDDEDAAKRNTTEDSTTTMDIMNTTMKTAFDLMNCTSLNCGKTGRTTVGPLYPFFNASYHEEDDDEEPEEDYNIMGSYASCPLLSTETLEHKIRLIAELLMLFGSVYYILSALREAKFLGYKMFIENLVSSNWEVHVSASQVNFHFV